MSPEGKPELMEIANQIAQSMGVTGVEELPPELKQIVEQIITGVAENGGDKEGLLTSGDLFGKMMGAVARQGKGSKSALGVTQEGTLANMQKAAALTEMAQDLFYNQDGSINRDGVGLMDADTFASYAAYAASAVPENGGLKMNSQQGPGSNGLKKTIDSAIDGGADKTQASISMMKEAEKKAADYEKGLDDYEKEVRAKGETADKLKRKEEEVKRLEKEIGEKFAALGIEESEFSTSTMTATDSEGNTVTTTRSSGRTVRYLGMAQEQLPASSQQQGGQRRGEEAEVASVKDVEDGKVQFPTYSNDYRKRVQSAILASIQPIKELEEMTGAKSFDEVKEEAKALGMPDITNPENAKEVGRKVNVLKRRAKKNGTSVKEEIEKEKDKVAEERKEEEEANGEVAKEETWKAYKTPRGGGEVKNDAEVMDEWMDELTRGKGEEVRKKGFAKVVNEADTDLTVFDVDKEKGRLNNAEVLNKEVTTPEGRKKMWEAMGYKSEEEARGGMKGDEIYDRIQKVKEATGSRVIPFTDDRHIAMAPEEALHRRRKGKEGGEEPKPAPRKKEEPPSLFTEEERNPTVKGDTEVTTYASDIGTITEEITSLVPGPKAPDGKNWAERYGEKWAGYKEKDIGDWHTMSLFDKYQEKAEEGKMTEKDEKKYDRLKRLRKHGKVAHDVIDRFKKLGLSDQGYEQAAKYISNLGQERGDGKIEKFDAEKGNAKEYVEKYTIGGQGLSVKETAAMLMNDKVMDKKQDAGATVTDSAITSVMTNEERNGILDEMRNEYATKKREEAPAPVKQEEGTAQAPAKEEAPKPVQPKEGETSERPPLKKEETKIPEPKTQAEKDKWVDTYRSYMWGQMAENLTGTWDEMNDYDKEMEMRANGEEVPEELAAKNRETFQGRRNFTTARGIINDFKKLGLSKQGYANAAKYISDLSQKRGDERVEAFDPKKMSAKEYVEKYTIGGQGLSVKETAEMLMDRDVVGKSWGGNTKYEYLRKHVNDGDARAVDLTLASGNAPTDEDIKEMDATRKEEREMPDNVPTKNDYSMPKPYVTPEARAIMEAEKNPPQPEATAVKPEETSPKESTTTTSSSSDEGEDYTYEEVDLGAGGKDIPERPELAVEKEAEDIPKRPELAVEEEEPIEGKRNEVKGLNEKTEEAEDIPELEGVLTEERERNRGEHVSTPEIGGEGGGMGGGSGSNMEQMLKFLEGMNDALVSMQRNVEGIRSDVERIKNQSAASMS